MGSGQLASLLVLLAGGSLLLVPHHAVAQDVGEDPVDEPEVEDVQDDATEILADKGIVKGQNFESSVYNTDICQRFDKFYKKKFGDEIDYDTCQLLYSRPRFAEIFRDYLKEWRKTYNATEQTFRYATFAANVLYIMVENANNRGFEVGVNQFADMTPDEFGSTHTGLTLGGTATSGRRRRSTGGHRRRRHPGSLDWIKKGAVNSPSPNQENCNSCWAFATAGAIEGAWKIKTGRLVVLSKRQIMDCAGLGCNFGNLQVPINGLVNNKAGICSESSRRYSIRPYHGVTRDCKKRCSVAVPAGNLMGFRTVKPNDELHLIDALVKKGPIAIGIDGLGRPFQFYKSGVLAPACSNTPNHAVLLIGYGKSGNRKYWMIKNSWGPHWGERGMFRLKRDRSGNGECALKSMPTYPLMKGARLLLDDDMETEIDYEDFEAERGPWENSSNASSIVAGGEMLWKQQPRVAAVTMKASPGGPSRFGLAACSLLGGLCAVGAFGWRLLYRSGSRRWLLLGATAE